MIFDKSGSLAATKRHDYAPFGEELFNGLRTTAMTENNGNLKRQEIYIPNGGPMFTQTFAYDNLNRLQRVTEDSSWQQEYSMTVTGLAPLIKRIPGVSASTRKTSR